MKNYSVQEIKIPSNEKRVYTVKRGDNLTKIAKKFNTTVSKLVTIEESYSNFSLSGTTIENLNENFEVSESDLLSIENILKHTVELQLGAIDAEISLLLCDEAEIQRLNREYRGIDSVTDVLSFPANDLEKPAENTTPSSSEGYLVKVTADVLNIRANAGTNYAVVGQIKDHGVYTIVAESNGTGASKWGKLKSGAGWISLDYVEKISSGKVETVTSSSEIKKGDKVKVKQGAKTYTGGSLASFVYSTTYDVIETNGDRVVIGKGNAVTAAVHKNNLIKV